MAKAKKLDIEETEQSLRQQYDRWMDEELEQIDDTLTRSLPDDMANATINADPKSKATLKEALVDSENFKPYHTFGNPDFADVVLDELIGVGLVPQILEEYPSTTDIGYNGKAMYLDTQEGKIPYARAGYEPDEIERTYFPQLTDDQFNKLRIIDHDYIDKLINRFATREKTQFTVAKPLFNGFSESIRISATHPSLAYEGVTMSLRITRASLALNDKNFGAFAPKAVSRLLDLAINAHTSVVLSGETGSGKTETAKYMLGFIDKVRGEPRDKIIVIEDIFEMQATKLYPEKDILEWQTTGDISISDHVKNALRNFPRWVIVSETRGAEAKGLLESVLSGSPVITTLHAVNNEAVPSRFTGMVAMAPGEVDLAATKNDFLTYFGLGIHISRRIFSNGKIQRYADEIVKFDPTAPNGQFWPILRQGFEEYGGKIHRWWEMYELPNDLKENLRIENNMEPGQMDEEWIPTYDYITGTYYENELTGYQTTGEFETVERDGKKYYKIDKETKERIPVYKLDENGNRIPIHQKVLKTGIKRDENGKRLVNTDENGQPIMKRVETIFNFDDFK